MYINNEKQRTHNVIPTDGTVVDNNVPSPKSNCVPFFNLQINCSNKGQLIY